MFLCRIFLMWKKKTGVIAIECPSFTLLESNCFDLILSTVVVIYLVANNPINMCMHNTVPVYM
jgi:hypothetical protein